MKYPVFPWLQVLGLLALFGGGLFLTTYLLIASVRAKGDMHEVLLGKARLSER